MPASSATLDLDTIRALPKTLLHDHLDGGLRPATVVELAASTDVELPTNDPERLQEWFHRGANRGSLPLYLEGFAVTTGILQDQEALRRAAREKAEDLAADGIVYAEVRFSPILHQKNGLNLEQVVSAVLAGIEEGCAGREIECRVILCAMRDMDAEASLDMAELAVDFRDRGVVGFDLAGDESGHPPKHHLEAFQLLRRENFNITIHGGEGFGLSSIWQAIQFCGAHRIGHATRLAEDIDDEKLGRRSRGTLAQYILDRRIPLEMCLSSNVHTGAVKSLEEHPFPWYLQRGFRVGLNTDNTLMSATTLSREHLLAHEIYGLGLDDLQVLALNGAKSAFCHHHERVHLIQEKILPGFRRVKRELLGSDSLDS
ncbi:MAG: adenosine deaminase [Planctomycetota bacterium]